MSRHRLSSIVVPTLACALASSACLILSKTKGGGSPAEVDPKVARTLGDSARYSARAAQGQPSLCPIDEASDRPLGVWAVAGGERPELWCFPVPASKYGGSTDWGSVRAIQDASALQTVLEDMTADERGVTFDLDDGGLWALVELSPTTFGVVRVPLEGERPRDLGEGLTRASAATPEQVEVDVLAPSSADAASVDLVAAKADLLARMGASLAARSASYLADQTAKLDAAVFPAAGMTDAALVSAAKAYLAGGPTNTGIEPTSVKVVRVASTAWDIRKDEDGLIEGQVADVAVGYATPDGGCAYVVFQGQRDYVGAGTYAERVYMNGFKTIPVAVRCERLP